MKQFKVKEKYLQIGWTYIAAESAEEAQEKLENGADGDFREEDVQHDETLWNTLQEVT
jgi:hypothetical protein